MLCWGHGDALLEGLILTVGVRRSVDDGGPLTSFEGQHRGMVPRVSRGRPPTYREVHARDHRGWGVQVRTCRLADRYPKALFPLDDPRFALWGGIRVSA